MFYNDGACFISSCLGLGHRKCVRDAQDTGVRNSVQGLNITSPPGREHSLALFIISVIAWCSTSAGMAAIEAESFCALVQ